MQKPWGCHEEMVQPILFREWVEKTFSVTIPKTGSEIVKYTSDKDDKTSNDPFLKWVNEICK